ncbi:MAG: FHA domain-containing protein [Actinobacteria bacterium]|nr:FHA domain-containing protein [Actinomycetota bacterium]
MGKARHEVEPEGGAMSSLNCVFCAEPLDPDDRFCPHCGTALESGQPTGVIPLVDESGPISVVAAEPLVDRDGVAADDLLAGECALIVRRGPDEGTRFLLAGDQMAAGRAAEAEIFLDDVTVSRRHADLKRSSGGWTIEDAGSLNGTYVNRVLVSRAVLLADGDEVQIGKYRFIFLVSGAE